MLGERVAANVSKKQRRLGSLTGLDLSVGIVFCHKFYPRKRSLWNIRTLRLVFPIDLYIDWSLVFGLPVPHADLKYQRNLPKGVDRCEKSTVTELG